MVNTNELKRGLVLKLENELYEVLEHQHYKPGKGQAFVRVKVRNIEKGSIVEKKLRSGEKVEDVFVQKISMTYSYVDGDKYVFIDDDTYESIEVPKTTLKGSEGYLTEGITISLKMYEGKIIGIELPSHVVLTVEYAEMGVKGDTATNASKLARLESGKEVMVPLFVNAGDKIKLDTRDGGYVERV